MFRASSAYVFRFDTGWQAESEGIYDFRYRSTTRKVFPTYSHVDAAESVRIPPGPRRRRLQCPKHPRDQRGAELPGAVDQEPGEKYLDEQGVLQGRGARPAE